MANYVTINNREYEVPEITFDTVCELEENGVSLLAMDEKNPKVATMVRAFTAWIIGCSPQQASREIQEHLKNGGSLIDLVNAITSALEESGFSGGNQQNTVQQFPDHQKPKRSNKSTTSASQK